MTKVYDYYSRMSKNNRIPKPYTGVKCRYKKSSDHDPFDLGWLSRRTVEDFRVTRQISSATIREYITLYPKQAIKYIEKYPEDIQSMFEKEYQIKQKKANLKTVEEISRLADLMARFKN